ncbi:hypothetical protein OH77DRAFT_1430114 [Trametes cingulata]|nr:hypothetical protein OH77DRAFT_1430114 [Trametes cingulata]
MYKSDIASPGSRTVDNIPNPDHLLDRPAAGMPRPTTPAALAAVGDSYESSILELPQEVMIGILLLLQPLDVASCRQVCRDWASICSTPILEYSTLLTRTGMMNGPAPHTSITRRLAALEGYHQAWNAARLSLCHGLPLPGDYRYDHLHFSETLVPIVHDSQLKLFSLPSAHRHVGFRAMSLDLKPFALRPQFCATDIPQGLLLIAGFLPSNSRILQCHILSLSALPTACYDGRATVPVLRVTTNFLFARTLQLNVCGDLLGWMWKGHSCKLKIHNWKTGELLWSFTHPHLEISFVFLDQSSVMVARHETLVLDVYTVVSREPAAPASARLISFSLPPLAEDASMSVKTLKSQVPPPEVDGGALFEADPQFSVLAVSFTITAPRTSTDLADSTDSEEYILITPLAALLAHVHRETPDTSREAVDHEQTIPWEHWGTSSSRLLHMLPGAGLWKSAHISALGSKCAVASYRPFLPLVLDVFIFDVHPFADGTDDDREELAGFIRTAPVMHGSRTLLNPLRNELPYRVWHKEVAYDDIIDFPSRPWTDPSFVALLNDGLVVANCSRSDMGLTILHTFSV